MYEASKTRSMTTTTDILKHYRELPDKYLNGNEFGDRAENSFTVTINMHALFDMHCWRLIPTATPDTYMFQDYMPRARQLLHPPSIIEFKDYGVEDEPPQPGTYEQTSGTRAHAQRGTELPSHVSTLPSRMFST